MSLVKASDFERDTIRWQERYAACRELNMPEAEAREQADWISQGWADGHIFPEHCLHCHEKLNIPFVYWMGSPDIGLHIECAEILTLGLQRDIIEYQCGRDQANQWYLNAVQQFRKRRAMTSPQGNNIIAVCPF